MPAHIGSFFDLHGQDDLLIRLQRIAAQSRKMLIAVRSWNEGIDETQKLHLSERAAAGTPSL
jgi:hypothetical protein